MTAGPVLGSAPMKSVVVALSFLALAACSKAPNSSAAGSSDKGAAAAPAPTTAASAAKGLTYGPKLSDGTPVPVSTIIDKIDEYDGKTVLVAGVVSDVCANRGCWLDIAGDRAGDTLRVKVKDGEIVFPMSAKGKRVVAEGIVRKLEPAAAVPPTAADTAAGHTCEDGTHESGHDCSRPPRARARLDGISAMITDEQS